MKIVYSTESTCELNTSLTFEYLCKPCSDPESLNKVKYDRTIELTDYISIKIVVNGPSQLGEHYTAVVYLFDAQAGEDPVAQSDDIELWSAHPQLTFPVTLTYEGSVYQLSLKD